MSLKGEINKYSGDIRRAINRISSQKMLGADGYAPGTKKTFGYVCAIHEEGDLVGTIDVQEFEYEPGEYDIPGAGHHKGVLLSAIQNNNDGVLIVPMMYSDVVIVKNPLDGREYVSMYSHAKEIRMTAQSIEGDEDGLVKIGVTEVEKFDETDDGLNKDYYELEPTSNQTNTVYTAKSIVDQITSPEDNEGFKQEKTSEHKIITVGDTAITIDGQNVVIETSGKVSFKIGKTEISCEDGNCQIKGGKINIEGSDVTLTGGNLKTRGIANTDMNGPFNAIKVCPFSGAPHCGSMVSGT